MKLSEFLFSITVAGRKQRDENSKMINLLLRVREQYKKFGLLSPRVQHELNEEIDEVRGGLPLWLKKLFNNEIGVSLEVFDVVPREEYESLRKSNERLHSLVAKYQEEKELSLQMKGRDTESV